MDVEVTAILPGGIRLLAGDRILFLSFDEFPWFSDAPVSAVLKVERPTEHHLYWPLLDVDLHVDSIDHPERFPLKSNSVPNTASQLTSGNRELVVNSDAREVAGGS